MRWKGRKRRGEEERGRERVRVEEERKDRRKGERGNKVEKEMIITQTESLLPAVSPPPACPHQECDVAVSAVQEEGWEEGKKDTAPVVPLV